MVRIHAAGWTRRSGIRRLSEGRGNNRRTLCCVTDDSDRQPRFRRGLDGLRQSQEHGEIKLRQDLTVIRHFADAVTWPTAAAEFARRVPSYFPDVDDDTDEWPDWSASEILEWIMHDLATALEQSATPPSD